MNVKKIALVLAAVVGFALLTTWPGREPAAAQEQPKGAAQKWEYKIILPDNTDDPRLNQTQFDKLGAEGWELCVSHSGTRPHYGIFKRPKR